MMTKAVSQITKNWDNPYGSQMSLRSNDGILFGQYASTAGATGRYRVFGYIDPQADAVTPGDPGVPLSLILNWRSIDKNSKPDPSWNYVSGMGGQLICNAAGETVINLNHALIASNPLPGAVSEAGFYVDRLEYDLAKSAGPAPDPDVHPVNDPPENPASQAQFTFVDEQDPTTKVMLLSEPDSDGFWAAFEWDNQATTLIGTCNTGYSSSIGPYQSIAFCGTILPGLALSLSGWLDRSTKTLTLQQYWIGPQKWDLRFFQARGRTLVMKQQ